MFEGYNTCTSAGRNIDHKRNCALYLKVLCVLKIKNLALYKILGLVPEGTLCVKNKELGVIQNFGIST